MRWDMGSGVGMSGEEPGCHRQEVGVKGSGGRAAGVKRGGGAGRV